MLEELKVLISAEIGKFKAGIAEAQDEIDKLADSDSKLNKLNDGFSKVGDVAKNSLKIAAGAAAAVGTALLGSVAATEEYRTAQAKLQSAFEDAGSSAEVAKNTYNDLYRVLGDGDVAVEAANHLAKLTTNQEHLSEWTDICQGVYATFGDSLPIEGLTEAANETAKTGALTGSLADALNWAGVSEDDFKAKLEACSSEQEREALIRETLNGLYSDAAASYEENAAALIAQNEAEAQMSENLARIGEAMAPVMTMLTELGAVMMEKIAPIVEEFVANHGPKIQEVLTGVAEKVGAVIGWIADNWEIVSTIGTIVLAVAAALSVLSTGLGIYTAVMTAASTITLPVIGIIAAITVGIALLVAGIVLLVKNWDTVKATASKVWEAVKRIVSDAVDAVIDFFTDLWDGITKKLDQIKETVSNKFEEVKKGMLNKLTEAKANVEKAMDTIKNAMGKGMEAAKATVSEKLNNIKTAYTEHGGGVKGIVAAYMEGVKGFYSAGYTFIDNLTNGKLSAMVETIKTKLNSAKETVSNVLEAIKKKFSDIWEGAKKIVSDAIDKLKKMMDFKWELPKIKLPHFSISGKFSLDPPSIPRISVKWYQKGGIFDSPTLFGYGNGQLGGLGEAGAEAIVPLENNTEWLDKIADRLSKNSNRPIVLQIDGKTLAETTINTINDLTRQTGRLNLVLP